MSYVYRAASPLQWEVGFYDPQGDWHHESYHASTDSAAERVRWLNGGNSDKDSVHLQLAMDRLANAITHMPHSVRMRP